MDVTRLPDTERSLLVYAEEITERCLSSQKSRLDQYSNWRSYFFSGSDNPAAPSIYNCCGPHIDRLASFLFSPADARLLVKFGRKVDDIWKKRTLTISEVLSDEFHGTGTDLLVSEGMVWALVYGMAAVKCAIRKTGEEEAVWDPALVLPSSLGVYNEAVNGFDKQLAIAHPTYITRDELWFRLRYMDAGKRAEIMKEVEAFAQARSPEEQTSMLHQVILGGPQGALLTPGSPSQGLSMVEVFNVAPFAQVAPETMQELVKFVELWVVDRERNDWTTLQYVEPGILIEGGMQKRNLFLPQRQPFQMIQPNPQFQYFWGRSELADLWRLQDQIAQRMDDIAHITRLQAHPPRALIGYNGDAQEARAITTSLDGLLMFDQPNAKVENLAPELPPSAFADLEKSKQFFDDVAGFTPLMQGQGEPGIRAGMHAQSLQRSASARLRDRALLVERQVGQIGDVMLEALADIDATTFRDPAAKDAPFGHQWILDQMPDDRTVQIDSHSSSPAFSEDTKQVAFALKKADAITNEGLLDLVHPPMLGLLKEQLKEHQAQEAEMIKQHPELLTKGKKR